MVIGWRKPTNTQPFMTSVLKAAPPPLPAPPAASARTAPCGITLHRLHKRVCSLCFGKVEAGVVLSDGEALCEVCVCETFSEVEQYECAPPPRPPVVLFARHGADGQVRREDLDA